MAVSSYVVAFHLFMILVIGFPIEDVTNVPDKPIAQYVTYMRNPNVTINMIFNNQIDKTRTETKSVDAKPRSEMKKLKGDGEFKSRNINTRRYSPLIENFIVNLIVKVGQTSTERHCSLFKDENMEERSKNFTKGKEMKAVPGPTAVVIEKESDQIESRNNSDSIFDRTSSTEEDTFKNVAPNFTETESIHKILRSMDDLSLEEEELAPNRIVGGHEVDVINYPYHAAYGDYCGAAIISSKWLITAAHCAKTDFVRVGSKYYKAGKEVTVKKQIIHPNWKSVRSKEHSFDYDYQLLELEDELEFNDNVQPVEIAKLEDYVVGKNVSVTGWGTTYEGGPYSKKLLDIDVPLVDEDECQSIDFPYFRGTLTKRMFCAGYKNAKFDACQGDSGGPAVSNHKLLGVVSFGYGCATPNGLGVYSNVAVVRDWITKITGIET